MNYPKYIFLVLILTITFQTACRTSARAEQTTTKKSFGEVQKSTGNIDSEKKPSVTTLPKPKPTAKPAAPKPSNAVCGNPSKQCANKGYEFAEWELPFQLPARIVPNKTYSSASFYAVIVKKYEDGCADLDENTIAEPERIELQKRFPANKVFAEYSCPNLSAVYYEFAGKRDAAGETVLYMDYVAVYVGDAAADAEKLRDELSAEFPEAEVKKMTANFGIIEQ